MSGIYIHIPFCKQACHYCDFHFSTNMQTSKPLINALKKEIEIRADYIKGPIQTIYFGGGTPSILSTTALAEILKVCRQHNEVIESAEITIEVNPDDISKNKLIALKETGFNRLSIGIQSFDSEVLKFLNRAHDEKEALQSIELSKSIDFDALSVDLIYGIPGRTHNQWKKDIKLLIAKKPEHISAYCLTIEPGTAFGQWFQKGELKAADEEFAATQFEILVELLAEDGYEQYEVSNFCRDDKYSKHNTSYWQQKPYLGIGPSAHSYNINSRQFNVKNNVRYINALSKGSPDFEIENLSSTDKMNDYLLTTLRTKWGSDLEKYDLKSHIDENYVGQLIDNRMAKIVDGHLILTKQGMLLADQISSDLFIIDS